MIAQRRIGRQARFQLADVARHDRPHISLQRDRAGALILAELRQDLRRQHNPPFVSDNPALQYPRFDPPLVLGIDIAEEEADRNRVHLMPGYLDPAPRQAPHVQRHQQFPRKSSRSTTS